MKKHVSKFILTTILTLSLGMTAFATNAPSLDDIVAGSSVQTEVSTTVTDNSVQSVTSDTSTDKYTNSSFVDGLTQAVDISTQTTTSAEVSKTLNYYGSIIFQCLAVVVSVGILLMVALDLVYITLPFTRSFLANGYMGNPNSSNNGMQPGVLMGGNPNPMGGSMGMRPGGGIFGGRGMSSPAAMGQQTAMQNQPSSGRVQYVSNAALNAVTGESATNKLALVEYLKDMSVTIICASVILVLAGTGVLSTLGLKIGEKLAQIISALTASIV